MTKLQIKRGLDAGRTFTPATGELIYSTDTKRMFIGDGSTAGGIGLCPLDSSSKISTSYLPVSITGQVHYNTVWNASTNIPALPLASSDRGGYYIVSAAGTYNSIDYQVGDWVISDGTNWSKVDNTDSISSWNGRIGAITPLKSDYSAWFADKVHTHLWADITDKPSTFAPSAHTHLWAHITDKPSTFTPSAHTHAQSEITGLETRLAGIDGNWVNYATTTALTNGLATKSDTSHVHTFASLTSKPTTLAGYGITDAQANLGYTPVQQGGGTGQGTNKVYVGWSAGGLLLQVDATNFGNQWPIAITGSSQDSAKLGGQLPSYYVNTSDSRLTDARTPTNQSWYVVGDNASCTRSGSGTNSQNTLRKSGFYSYQAWADSPVANTWTHLIHSQYHNDTGSTNSWSFDIAANFGSAVTPGSAENYYMRCIANSVTTGWRKLWHDGNFDATGTISRVSSLETRMTGVDNNWGNYQLKENQRLSTTNEVSFSGLKLGYYSNTVYSGIWHTSVTKGDNNWAFLTNNTNAQTYLNASTSLELQIFDGTNRNTRLQITNTMATFGVGVTSNGRYVGSNIGPWSGVNANYNWVGKEGYNSDWAGTCGFASDANNCYVVTRSGSIILSNGTTGLMQVTTSKIYTTLPIFGVKRPDVDYGTTVFAPSTGTRSAISNGTNSVKINRWDYSGFVGYVGQNDAFFGMTQDHENGSGGQLSIVAGGASNSGHIGFFAGTPVLLASGAGNGCYQAPKVGYWNSSALWVSNKLRVNTTNNDGIIARIGGDCALDGRLWAVDCSINGESVNSTTIGSWNTVAGKIDNFVQGSGNGLYGRRTTNISSFDSLQKSGFYDMNAAGPFGTTWQHLIRSTHTDPTNAQDNWSFDISAAFANGNGSEGYKMRVNTSAGWGTWRTIWTNLNLNQNCSTNQAPTFAGLTVSGQINATDTVNGVLFGGNGRIWRDSALQINDPTSIYLRIAGGIRLGITATALYTSHQLSAPEFHTDWGINGAYNFYGLAGGNTNNWETTGGFATNTTDTWVGGTNSFNVWIGGATNVITASSTYVSIGKPLYCSELHSTGSYVGTGLFAGTGDGASLSTYNQKLTSWYGTGIWDACNAKCTGYIDHRAGNLYMTGNIQALNGLIGSYATISSQLNVAGYMILSKQNISANTNMVIDITSPVVTVLNQDSAINVGLPNSSSCCIKYLINVSGRTCTVSGSVPIFINGISYAIGATYSFASNGKLMTCVNHGGIWSCSV